MLTPIKSNKLYEIIMQEIKGLVRSGELKCGDKLPSERVLAEKLNVSRASIREALKALENLGLIESKHGGGNYIKSDFENILLEPLSIAFLLLGHRSEEVLEIRKIIEPEVAKTAALNIDDNELLELAEITHKIDKEQDFKICAELDKEFHYKIAMASKNHLLSVVIFSISSLIEEYIDEADIYNKKNNKKQKINDEHKEIFKALKNHDGKQAFLCAKKHLEREN